MVDELTQAMFSEVVYLKETYRAALLRIADLCPATCDITLAHEMAQIAEEALLYREARPVGLTP